MFAKTFGAATNGIDGVIIDVEVDVSSGMPRFDMVGRPDASVRESKERVRTGIKNAGIKLRQENVTVNLAPAGIRKDSSGLDLPIAVALLAAYGIIPPESIRNALFSAEMSLEGEMRSVPGILPMVIKARDSGIPRVYVAKENINEALLVDDIEVYSVPGIAELVEYLNGRAEWQPEIKKHSEEKAFEEDEDFADVQGQFLAKRSFEIAAAGGHNILLVGSPGAGKSMLSKRLGSILPEMEKKEALEVTKIYSIAGLLKDNRGLVSKRPFRSPHHTTSAVALIGGGSIPRPGEVTLSHNGVLFLDELPEFSKQALEVLREPLEDGRITISRVNASLTFPSSIILVAAMNPCPCGYFGDKEHVCECSSVEIKRYVRRISGPLLDRIDIQIRVPRVSYKELKNREKAEASAIIRKRVSDARKRQLARLSPYGLVSNSQMNHSLLMRICQLTSEAERLMEQAFNQKKLSARSYDRLIKVAQTIADLAGSDKIDAVHIGEAIQLRGDLQLNVE